MRQMHMAYRENSARGKPVCLGVTQTVRRRQRRYTVSRSIFAVPTNTTLHNSTFPRCHSELEFSLHLSRHRIGKIIGSECASASTTRVHHSTRWYRPGRTTMTNHLQTELGRSWMTWCNRFAIQKHTRPDTVQLHLAFASYRIGKTIPCNTLQQEKGY